MVPVWGRYTWSDDAVADRVVQPAFISANTPGSRHCNVVRSRNWPASHTIVVRLRMRALYETASMNFRNSPRSMMPGRVWSQASRAHSPMITGMPLRTNLLYARSNVPVMSDSTLESYVVPPAMFTLNGQYP